jgi:predicted RNA-binding protein YlxR (DUF448 family)
LPRLYEKLKLKQKHKLKHWNFSKNKWSYRFEGTFSFLFSFDQMSHNRSKFICFQIQMQQLSAKQDKEQQGRGGYITAEDFKAMEEKKRLAKELAAEQEKIREEEAEKNFSYQDLGNPGLSWDALGAAVVSTNRAQTHAM